MRWSQETTEADWIGPRLAEFHSGLVTSTVPSGFAAYARILHPSESDAEGTVVRWSDVAAWSGLPLEPDSQFHDIALPEHEPGTPAPWHNQGPIEGTLAPGDAMALTEILRAHTDSPDRCWFCLWEGFGWENTVVMTASTDPDPPRDPPRLPDPIPAEVRAGGRVRLPCRDYFLYTGPVEDAVAFVETKKQTANLWWPADRSWCVASEIDLAWSYVGGSAELVRRILEDPRIEALPVDPLDNHHLRVKGWLAETIDAATTELLTEGSTTIVTSRGTVGARLERTGFLKRRTVLRTWHGGRDGVSGSSGGRLSFRTDEELRERFRSSLTRAVVCLVDG